MINQTQTKIYFGGDYNPEQWLDKPHILEEDMRLMKKAGCNVMSIGIFSWSLIEKQENIYDFSFLDMIMDMLCRNGIGAILATPSAAMPNWLAKKYPEVLRTDENYVRDIALMRTRHCPTSKIYREKVHKINELLAERYKNHPALKMWHVSNEYFGSCYCEQCKEAFRQWLKKKYNGDLDLFNKKMWNSFWSSYCSDWDEIDPPVPSSRTYGSGLLLEWKRFSTEQTIDFFRNEAEPLKRITPDIPITTNFHGDLSDIDYRRFANEIDCVSWDIYPHWHEKNDAFVSSEASFVYDICRSMKHKPFLIMENTPGAISTPDVNKPKKPGMNILSAMHAVSHGADMIGYFQWRKGLGGYEKMHGAIVDHSGRDDTRIFKEISELGEMLSQLDDICASETKSEVALIYDWECRWTLDNVYAYNGKNKEYKETCIRHYDCLQRLGISVDIISQTQDFSQYKMIIAPMFYLAHNETLQKLEEYVKNGGTLVMTYLSGICDDYDLCYYGGFPAGVLKDVFGIWAEETDALTPDERNTVIAGDKTYMAKDLCELIHTTTADAIALFDSDYYKGMPAVTKNNYGCGTAYYIGFRDDSDYLRDFYSAVTGDIEKLILPEGVKAAKRYSENYEYLFIQNFNTNETTVEVDDGYSLSDGTTSEKTVKLKPYGTCTLKKPKNK